MRDSPSASPALAMFFCEINDFIILTAVSVSSLPNNTDDDMRILASSMFFTVMPVA